MKPHSVVNCFETLAPNNMFYFRKFVLAEAVVQRYFVTKIFLETS